MKKIKIVSYYEHNAVYINDKLYDIYKDDGFELGVEIGKIVGEYNNHEIEYSDLEDYDDNPGYSEFEFPNYLYEIYRYFMKQKQVEISECPDDGDPANDCRGCCYGGDYHYDPDTDECVRREEEE